MTSFYACYYNCQNVLRTICQVTSLSLWSIDNQPFILVASRSNFKVFYVNLTASLQCILGVIVTGIE